MFKVSSSGNTNTVYQMVSSDSLINTTTYMKARFEVVIKTDGVDTSSGTTAKLDGGGTPNNKAIAEHTSKEKSMRTDGLKSIIEKLSLKKKACSINIGKRVYTFLLKSWNQQKHHITKTSNKATLRL